jgi:hypothetical protein
MKGLHKYRGMAIRIGRETHWRTVPTVPVLDFRPNSDSMYTAEIPRYEQFPYDKYLGGKNVPNPFHNHFCEISSKFLM